MRPTPTPIRASLALLKAAYPKAVITNETIAVYETALADLDPNLLYQAVTRIVKESNFLPTIAEIRRVAAESQLDLPNATEAYIEAEARALGRWHKPRTPLVSKAIRGIGGHWVLKTSGNPSITRSQFVKAYEELRERMIKDFAATGRVEIEEEFMLSSATRAIAPPSELLPELPAADVRDNLARLEEMKRGVLQDIAANEFVDKERVVREDAV